MNRYMSWLAVAIWMAGCSGAASDPTDTEGNERGEESTAAPVQAPAELHRTAEAAKDVDRTQEKVQVASGISRRPTEVEGPDPFPWQSVPAGQASK